MESMNFYQHITKIVSESFDKNLKLYIEKFADVLVENNKNNITRDEIINIWNDVFGSKIDNNGGGKCIHILKNGKKCENKATKEEYCGRHVKSQEKEEKLCIREKKDGEICGKKVSVKDGESDYCSRHKEKKNSIKEEKKSKEEEKKSKEEEKKSKKEEKKSSKKEEKKTSKKEEKKTNKKEKKTSKKEENENEEEEYIIKKISNGKMKGKYKLSIQEWVFVVNSDKEIIGVFNDDEEMIKISRIQLELLKDKGFNINDIALDKEEEEVEEEEVEEEEVEDEEVEEEEE